MPVVAAIPPGPHAGRIWHDAIGSPVASVCGGAVRSLTNYRGHSHHLVGAAPCWLDGGRRLVLVSDRDGWGNLFVYDFSAASLTQLTDLRGTERPADVAIAPRGRLTFHYGTGSYELDRASLWLRPLSRQASRPRAGPTFSRQIATGETIAADGCRVIWVGTSHTVVAATEGSGRAPFSATAPCVSPDGRRVVFVSDASGYAQIYAVELPAALVAR
jgi:Tol biopolymer transport system component